MEIGFRIGRRWFEPKLKTTVVCLLGFLILCGLGKWQIYRYHYKSVLLATFHAHETGKPEDLAFVDHETRLKLKFLHVILHGNYINKFPMLLAHRTHGEHNGYDVVSLFRLKDSHQYVLVNRGWIGATYGDIPQVSQIAGESSLTGYIKYPEYEFTLGKNILHPNQFPLVMQKIQFKQLQKLLGVHLLPFVIRMDKTAPHGFVRDWQVINVMPSRHMSYAIQWFGMALGLLVVYFLISSKKIESKEKSNGN